MELTLELFVVSSYAYMKNVDESNIVPNTPSFFIFKV